MDQDRIGYDKLTQDALRGVMRQALTDVARDGMPGAHHFYITIRTQDVGVDLDESLIKKYPDEMTIVLEHQFWDLNIDDETFEVTLKFSGVPRYLKVPFSAVIRFHDPSVGFSISFDSPEKKDGSEGFANSTKLTRASKKKSAETAEDEETKSSGEADKESATVVSLDSFRDKKS